MPRFADVMQYLDQNYARLGLNDGQKRGFASLMQDRFTRLNYPDDVLSLNWTRFNRGRPDADSRVEIRLCLLAGMCRKELSLPDARQYVTRSKAILRTKSKTQLDTEATRLILKALGRMRHSSVEAVRLSLQAHGDPSYAIAHTSRLGQTVDEYLIDNAGHTLAVMLIDMQSDGVGHETYCGETVLEHQKRTLELAGIHNLHVYDIVIDLKHAKGESGQTVFTIRELSEAFRDARVHHIPKPSHPSFIGTDLADLLDEHKVREIIVMGYDANQCVKATIFGGPKSEWTVPAEEREQFLKAYASENATWKNGKGTKPYVPGLLDRGYNVITSRAILASGGRPLEPNYGALAGL